MASGSGAARILSMRFNQPNSCVAVGTTRGYRIYNCVPFAKGYDSSEGGAGIVEMLFHTSLVSLVGAGEQASFSPRRLRLWNTKTETEICDLNFVHTVVNVRLNRSRLIALLENKIHLFDLKSMKILHTLDTVSNPTGVCALSPSVDNCFLAFPASETKGEILIYDALNLQVITSILAHDAPIRLLAFNPEGNLLASCSHKGTVIRVFSIPDGKKLFTFRRGSYEAVINSISFNSTSTLIALSSTSSSTVHIFSLTAGADKSPPAAATTINGNNGVHHTTNGKPNGTSGGSGGSSGGSVIDHKSTPDGSRGTSGGANTPPPPLSPTGSVAPAAAPPVSTASLLATQATSTAVAISNTVSTQGSKLLKMIGVGVPSSLLPNALTNYMDPTRNFARVVLKDGTQVVACGLLGVDTVLVITAAGHLFRYRVPTGTGGDCKLEAEHTLLDHPSEIIGVKFIPAATTNAPTAGANANGSTAHVNGSGGGGGGSVANDSENLSASTIRVFDHRANSSTGLKIQTNSSGGGSGGQTHSNGASTTVTAGGSMSAADQKYGASRPNNGTGSGGGGGAISLGTPSPASALPPAAASTHLKSSTPPPAAAAAAAAAVHTDTAGGGGTGGGHSPQLVAASHSKSSHKQSRHHHKQQHSKQPEPEPPVVAAVTATPAEPIVTTAYSATASSIVVNEEDDEPVTK